jgi:hypothetical protein
MPALLPTPGQDLLLKACVLDGDEALDSWRRWRATTSLETIDAGSIRLLPMLADTLQRLGAEDPEFGKYRGVQRRTWARSRLLFRGAGRILAALNGAQIPAMALKGLALASTYYPTDSMRPMGDIDLLVPRDEAFRSFDVLESIGWRSVHRRPSRLAHLAIHHALPFQDPTTSEVDADIHWGMLYGRYSDAAEAATWDAAVPIEIEGATAVAPCAADLLIHVCIHGMRWNDMPPVRWVVDAAMIVRSGRVDWEHLVIQSSRWGAALPLARAFAYLRGELRLAIPDEVIGRLDAQASTPTDEFLFAFEQKPMRGRRFADVMRMHLHLARGERERHRGAIGYWGYFNALRQWHSLGRMIRWQWHRISGRSELELTQP